MEARYAKKPLINTKQPMENESKSETPESDELAAVLIHPDSIMSFRKYIKRSLKLCRKLERQRNEAREQARNADLRVTRAKRERDGAWAARERLANAITNAAGVLSFENVKVHTPLPATASDETEVKP